MKTSKVLFKPLKTKNIKNKKITNVAAVIFNNQKEILIVKLKKEDGTFLEGM